MLKVLKFSKSRAIHACRHISATSMKWQSGEVVKADQRDDAIRVVQKKPQREPLVKNFYFGIVDTDLMAYPEAIYENEHLDAAKQRKKMYDDFLETNIFSNPDDANNINKLKEFGCFKFQNSVVTEAMFSVTETESKYLSYGTFLNNHQQVLKLINEFGDPSQKLKYLPKLESGDSFGVSCLFEPKPPAKLEKMFGTEAIFDDAKDEYILNGEKSFVLVSPAHKDSTTFVVVSSIESTDRLGNFEEGLLVLLVDGSLSGVSISSVDQTLGYKEKPFKQVTVSFKNVTVDKSCAFGDGLKTSAALLNISRLDKGAQAINGAMKPIINHLVEYFINTKVQKTHLKDVDSVKEQIGSLTSKCYALESMVYMTSSLIDIYNKQDIELEAAIVQAYAIQSLTDFMVKPMHAVGPRAIVEGSEYERYIRNAAQMASSGEPLDGIKQFISLSGLNFLGKHSNESVKMQRNPLNHPSLFFSTLFKEMAIENPKKRYNLEHFLHPSLDPAAHWLEASILRFNAAADILLARHGSLVAEHSAEVAKIADAAILCYAMFCTTARASRSYCIGLRNADQEIFLANCFCYEGSEKVKQIVVEIDRGEFGTSEHTFKTVGQKLIETKEYHLVHPTTRNF